MASGPQAGKNRRMTADRSLLDELEAQESRLVFDWFDGFALGLGSQSKTEWTPSFI